HFETALRMNPNDPDLMMWSAAYYNVAGEFHLADSMIRAAERLNPLPPAWYRNAKAITEYGLRHYAAAAELLESQGSDKLWWSYCYLAACYQRLGDTQEAKRQVAMALTLRPTSTIKELAAAEPYTNADDLEHLLEPVRQAGLPN